MFLYIILYKYTVSKFLFEFKHLRTAISHSPEDRTIIYYTVLLYKNSRMRLSECFKIRKRLKSERFGELLSQSLKRLTQQNCDCI